MDYTEIINQIIALAFLLLNSFLVPQIDTFLKERNLTKQARIAVSFAEQMAAANGWDGDAKYKKAFDYMKAQNLKFDDAKIQATIEAEVYNIKNKLLTDEKPPILNK